jgi:hypothetical protein
MIFPDGKQLVVGDRPINLKEIGIYLEGSQQTPLAVNLDYTESNYSPIKSVDNERVVFCGTDWKSVIFEARYGFELWKYLLIAVILLFLLEMWLIKREERNA